jgi:hypothetical protein
VALSLVLEDLATAVALFASLFLSFEIGFRFGKRASRRADARAVGQVGAIQGATLGLLGLLLGFSFAAAGSRFLERQDLIVEEANAIGTAWLRADLLDEPHRSDLRAALKLYNEQRLEMSKGLRTGLGPEAAAEVERLQARIWAAASAGVAAKPAVMIGVLPPVNEVIDLHATRVAASHKHLPVLVMGLLIACSMLAVTDIGYGCGTSGKRHASMTVPLAVVIGTALWITIDLDQPRAGLIQLNDAPLQNLKLEPPAESGAAPGRTTVGPAAASQARVKYADCRRSSRFEGGSSLL